MFFYNRPKITIISLLFLISFSFSCKKKDSEPVQMLPTSIEFVTKSGTSLTEYVYDSNNILSELKNYNNGVLESRFVCEYNSNNQLSKTTRFDGNSTTSGGYTSYGYNPAGRPDKLINVNGSLSNEYVYQYSGSVLTKFGLKDGSYYQRYEYDGNGNVNKVHYYDNSQGERLALEVTKYDTSKRGIFSGLEENLRKALFLGSRENFYSTQILHCPIDYKYFSSASSVASIFNAQNTFNAEGYPVKITYTPPTDINNSYWDDPNIVINITYKRK